MRVRAALNEQGLHTIRVHLGEGLVGSQAVNVTSGPPDFLQSRVRPLSGGEIKTGKSATGVIEMELFDRFGNACANGLRDGDVKIDYFFYHEKRKATDHK